MEPTVNDSIDVLILLDAPLLPLVISCLVYIFIHCISADLNATILPFLVVKFRLQNFCMIKRGHSHFSSQSRFEFRSMAANDDGKCD